MQGYRVIVTAKPGCWLLGGVKVLRSSCFETYRQAEAYAQAIADVQSAAIQTSVIRKVTAPKSKIVSVQL